MSLAGGSSGLGPRCSAGLLLLALLLLPAAVPFAGASGEAAGPEEGEEDLHCVCVKTTSGVHPKHFTSLEVIKAGPHCAAAQMIATLKNGRKICLDPQAPLYKKVIKKLLSS